MKERAVIGSPWYSHPNTDQHSHLVSELNPKPFEYRERKVQYADRQLIAQTSDSFQLILPGKTEQWFLVISSQ